VDVSALVGGTREPSERFFDARRKRQTASGAKAERGRHRPSIPRSPRAAVKTSGFGAEAAVPRRRDFVTLR
jgi:hypothetical protein